MRVGCAHKTGRKLSWVGGRGHPSCWRFRGCESAFSVPEDLLSGERWQAILDDLAIAHDVPGLQAGLLILTEAGADIRTLAAGVISRLTDAPVALDTHFHYGSISKVWTATLIMQLVDEGRLTLDSRVVDVLPEFALADRYDADQRDAEKITVIQLLDHTSGIDGDLFFDTGEGDDCIEKYVALLADTSITSRIGGPMSYSNSGYVVLGRIVEVLRGLTWEKAVAEFIIGRLALENVVPNPKDAPASRLAIGHVPDPEAGGKLVPAPSEALPRAVGPAGLVTRTAESLLAFAAAHLRDGLGLNGERMLSEASARSMRRLRVPLDELSSEWAGWAVGWSLEQWKPEIAVSHNGDTVAQHSYLDSFPEHGIAIALLGTGPHVARVEREFSDAVARELRFVAPKIPPVDETIPVDTARIVGTYETSSAILEVRHAVGTGLTIQMSPKEGAPGAVSERSPLLPVGPRRFSATLQGRELEITTLSDDGNDYLWLARLVRKTS